MDQKSPEEHFKELIDAITAIPEDELAPINMPPEEAMHEGKRAAALVAKYKDRLLQSDIDPVLLDSINPRAEAYAFSVAQCDAFIKDEEQNKEMYKVKKKQGYALRKKLLDSLTYLFRKHPGLLDSLARIRNGRGILEMVKDLLSLYKLANDQKEILENNPSFDMALVGQAMNLHEGLADLSSQIAIDPEKINKANAICAKAWTYLWEALEEIYPAGRYVFMDEPEIAELFYIDYRQELRKNARRDVSQEPQPVA